MRVVVLGGGGAMAAPAIEAAAGFDGVTGLVIADLDRDAARVAAELGGPKAEPCMLDVTDEAALASVLGEADAVMNFVGPYYRFGGQVLDATITARCHYLDICDDWEPTLDLLDRHDAARVAGVTCVIGLGASPGISNLLAATAMSRLDHVDEIITAWSLEGGVGELPADELSGDSSAAIEHWIHQISGTIRVVHSGRMVDVSPLQQEMLLYPGHGEISGWSIGHPEPLTLARTRPELRRSVNVMIGADQLLPLLRLIARRVDRDRTDAAAAARKVSRFLGIVAKAPPFVQRYLSSPERTVPALAALATGERGGVPVRVGAGVRALPPGGMAAMTGIPAAIGLQLLASGELDEPGVHPPEAVIDPSAFFDGLAPWCEPACRTGADVISVRELIEPPDPFARS